LTIRSENYVDEVDGSGGLVAALTTIGLLDNNTDSKHFGFGLSYSSEDMRQKLFIGLRFIPD